MGTRSTVATITAAFHAIKSDLVTNRTVSLRRLRAADRLLRVYARRCLATQFNEALPDAVIDRAVQLGTRIDAYRLNTLDYRIQEAEGHVIG